MYFKTYLFFIFLEIFNLNMLWQLWWGNIKIDVLGLIDEGFIKEICRNRFNFITMQNISPFETSRKTKTNERSEIGNAYKIIKY